MAKFTRELEELVANQVITPEVADNIRNYYDRPSTGGQSKLVIAFAVIGALLVGMGIVLIIAHNWDDFSNATKLFFGLAPLFVCQALAGWLIWKKSTSSAWNESVAVLLVFAIATAISIVSQVYNISGSLAKFLLVWSILSLPIMYLLRSWMGSLLYWCGITWYASETGFSYRSDFDPRWFWLLALAAVPFYVQLIRKTPNANSISFHNWIIVFATTLVLPMHTLNEGDLIAPAYATLFSVFVLVGQLPYFESRKLISNAWLVGGSGGMIIFLLIMTFDWPGFSYELSHGWFTTTFFMWVGLFVIATGLLIKLGNERGYKNLLSKSYTFIIFLFLVLIGFFSEGMSMILTNVLLLALGVYTIREGALANQLWKMNYGLLILSVLIACRFFDTDISFVVRGLLFVAIGVGFFGMNYYTIRKRKTEA